MRVSTIDVLKEQIVIVIATFHCYAEITNFTTFCSFVTSIINYLPVNVGISSLIGMTGICR